MVDTPEKLNAFLPLLKRADWVSLDTEADSLHAYPEKVCLIQISVAREDKLIDPLAGLDLKPLLEALGGHELIMHGADYDLRLLRKHHEFVPKAVFDTMLAGRLLGFAQFGFSHLVERYLGEKLEKGPQKANWAVRPLTPRMERYARNDTHYLKPLADKMKEELQERGRLGWHRQLCDRLIAEAGVERRPDMDAVWRVKGSHGLSRPALAVLREVWKWRESEAIASNKPPFFVMSHEGLVVIAAAAVNGGGGEVEKHFPKHLSERRRRGLRQAVERALALPPEQQPHVRRSTSRRATEAERKRYAEIQRRRDSAASALGIDPTLIASRSVLSDLANNWDKNQAELMPWQRELLKRPEH